jgi:Mrp family chromosome partitioning ATPase
MTGKRLLDKLNEIGGVEHSFRFPYAYVRTISSDFEGKDDDERESFACQKMQLSLVEVRKTSADCLLTLQWMTPEEASAQPVENRGEHWLRAFLRKPTERAVPPQASSHIRVAHFYGYKGGQGRSTVLACLAQKLALDGARVLVVDADIEAPSLDVIFGVTPNALGATLLGLVQNRSEISAVSALTGRNGGEVRILACRPRESAYAIDFAAFALQTSLVPGVLANGIERLRQWSIDRLFDVVLVDHRSGMAMTTLTWMKALPGPAVIFTKLDEQWHGAEDVFREVLGANPDNPGLMVTFKPDEETDDGFRRRTKRQRDELLQLVGESIAQSLSVPVAEDIAFDPANFEDRWLLWPYDQAFRGMTLPDQQDLGANTKGALAELTRLLEIVRVEKKKLSGVGSRDEGDLIQTEALMRLRQSDNGIRYIFGRKGTGKTRLATQLSIENRGESLLVDASSDSRYGLNTAGAEFSRGKEFFKEQPEGLWWAILYAALQGPDTEQRRFQEDLNAIIETELDATVLRQKVMEVLPKQKKRIFLVDGIETAFNVSNMYRYIESLFSFLLTLQSEERFNDKIEVKLFLRSDLASRSVQNLEQQIESRTIDLFWDYQKILNFLLSRLPALSFFCQYFPETIGEINGMMNDIRAGVLPIEEGERLLLHIFPDKLKRFNILTSTFLRLHFADSASQGASYYPRVIDSFLKSLDESGRKKKQDSIVDARLDQQLIIQAHERASADYMRQINQELEHLLDFESDNMEANNAKLVDWINAFIDQKTPFNVEEMQEHLSARTTLNMKVVRRCLDQMVNLGIFERSSDDPTVWKTGRLFKSSLKMKFNRKFK